MAKSLVLEVEYEFDFILIGIASHVPNYRLSWLINNALEIDFERLNDVELIVDPKEGPGYFGFYSYNEEENYTTLNLISNRSSSGYLIPELKQIDYFIQYWGPYQDEDSEELLKKIKEIPQVLTALYIDPYSLKSRNNLLF